MSTFHTLHLRESTNRKEKSQTHRQQNRQRQKTYIKDLLVSNILKKFGNRAVSQQAVAGNYYLQALVASDVEEFVNKETLTQKNLSELEKRLQQKLLADPKLKELFNEKSFTRSAMNIERPDHNLTHDIRISNGQSQFKLPNINASVTPTRKNESQINIYQKNKLGKLRQSMQQYQLNKSSLSHVYPKYPNNSLSANKQIQQSMQVLDNKNAYSLVPQQNNINYQGKKDSMTHRQVNGDKEVSKSFADLKVRMGGHRRRLSGPDEVESRPSEISEDEWAEIVRFQKEEYEENKRKEREQLALKKETIKKTLDHQLQEKRRQRMKEIEERQSFEKNLLQNLKEREQQEKDKELQMKEKVLEQKALRDVQLQQSKQKKEQEYYKQRQQELDFMNKLKQEINEERQNILEKKRKEREVCQKIIQENEVYKQKQEVQKEIDRQKEIQQREEYDRMLELQDKKRQEEWNQREARIANLVNKMADTVVRKNNDKEKELEKKVVQYQLEKEDKDARKEMLQKQKLKKKYEDIQQSLQMQIKEKRQQKDQENLANELYIKKQMNNDEEAKRKIKEELNQKRQKEMELQDFLKRQMEESGIGDGTSVASKTKKGTHNGHQMNYDEYKMNKQLLMEISKKKKQRKGDSVEKSGPNSFINDSAQKGQLIL